LQAYFKEAQLDGADLQGEQIKWAIGDEATTLPDGLDWPTAWSKSVEEQEEILRE
jgi:hypothetical protein